MGVMTSYASYNDVNQPIIGNALRVSLSNSCFSFVAGFAVFSTVGYLQGMQSQVADKVSSIGLAFVAYPAAIETMPAPNLWSLILAVTLFTLGLDSAFSMVEATSTVVSDTTIGRMLPRKLIALILCGTGCCCSFVFCFNWGFTYFDTVDHYLAVYLLLLLGIMQAFGAGWVYEASEVIASVNKVTVMTLAIGYWAVLLPLGLLAYFAFPLNSWVAMPVFWGIQVIVWIVSFATSKLSFGQWYKRVFLCGVGKLARSMAKLSTGGKRAWWCGIFEFWWGFSIKYFFPWAVWWLLCLSFSKDVAEPYDGNYIGW
jgi:SNF family Na+-dependent transporter